MRVKSMVRVCVFVCVCRFHSGKTQPEVQKEGACLCSLAFALTAVLFVLQLSQQLGPQTTEIKGFFPFLFC